VEQWPTFFRDLFTLISPTESSSQPTFNPHVSLLFFHMILEISGEVADQMLKAARQHNSARHARDSDVRDAVRERDAARINEAVLTIVAANVEKMTKLRVEDESSISRRELDTSEEVVDWGVRTFGSYVGWIDINLTVTATTVQLLFGLLSDTSLPIRLATCVALSRIVSKGLKESTDKLQLIKVLSLGDVLASLEHKTREQQATRRVDIDDVDEGEESYREALGRLLNVLGLELCKLSEVCGSRVFSCDFLTEELQDSQTDLRSEAVRLLEQVLPVMLRFLADDYDDTSSTVFTLLQTVLSNVCSSPNLQIPTLIAYRSIKKLEN
jgi:exportin-T